MLRLHIPRRDEFAIRRAWLADPQMMSYNAGWDIDHPGYDRRTGCIIWPESEWAAFEALLAQSPAQQCYYFVEDLDSGTFVGHAHYRVDDLGTAHVGVNVVPSRRGEGLGHVALGLVVATIWRSTEATEIQNDFEDGRESAVRIHARAGFVPSPALSRQGTRTWRLVRPNPPMLSS